jgi:membrane-bound serine protease (ClpP class)
MELTVTLLVIGGLLMLAETVLPGMVAGILGFLCIVGGVIAGYTKLEPPAGHYILLGTTLALVAGTVAWFRLFPNSRFARVFISQRAVGNLGVEQPALLHQTGTALSHLRPSGMALINGHRVDVVTEGGLIERGAAVKVVAVEGMRVIVRAVAPDLSSKPTPT